MAWSSGGECMVSSRASIRERLPPDRVDLPVVEQQAVGVRPLPAGVGVGGEAGVDQGDGRGEALVLQVRVEQAKLVYQEHALVDDGPAAQAGDIGIRHGLLELPAHDVQPPVKFQVALGVGRAGQDRLPDAGHTVHRPLA